ncbi:MAG: YjbQ family protein [Calditrichaeota bacterium]|nr:YjbQ family protein [Calditrichota bacterium]
MTKISTHTIELSTQGHTHIVDITPDVQRLVAESGLKEGHVLIFVPGSTGGLTTIEYEPGLLRDLPEFLEEIIPSGRRYHHDDTWHDGNGYAHLRAALIQPDLMVPFVGGKLTLGTWQQIIFIDFDNRPRHRRLVVQIWGQ